MTSLPEFFLRSLTQILEVANMGDLHMINAEGLQFEIRSE